LSLLEQALKEGGKGIPEKEARIESKYKTSRGRRKGEALYYLSEVSRFGEKEQKGDSCGVRPREKCEGGTLMFGISTRVNGSFVPGM